MPALADEQLAELYRTQAREAGVLAVYERLLKEGKSPGFAAMLAMQQPPGSRFTDRAFCDGQRRKMERMSDVTRRAIQENARRAGISTDGKFYVGGLGRPDDPAAWVTSADDVLAVAKKRNLGVEGVLRHKSVDECGPPKPPVPLAEPLVRELMAEKMAADPGLAARCRKSRKARQELREAVLDKHGRKPRTSRGRTLRRAT